MNRPALRLAVFVIGLSFGIALALAAQSPICTAPVVNMAIPSNATTTPQLLVIDRHDSLYYVIGNCTTVKPPPPIPAKIVHRSQSTDSALSTGSVALTKTDVPGGWVESSSSPAVKLPAASRYGWIGGYGSGTMTWQTALGGKPAGIYVDTLTVSTTAKVRLLIVIDSVTVTPHAGTIPPPPPPPAPTPPPPGPIGVTVTVDTTVRYQTMTGWEATTQLGQDQANYATWQNAVLDSATALGINRVRLQITSTAEPSLGTFDFSGLDSSIVIAVAPLRQRLVANGEHLYVSLNLVAFRQTGPLLIVPANYATLILRTFQHMQSAYGFVPDGVEVILEPDNGTLWTGAIIGQAIKAAGDTLSAHGFRPDFVAPSTMSMSQTVSYLNFVLAVPGVSSYLKEVSYHRYAGVSDANLAAIHALALAHNLRTAMLEHIGSDVEDLYADLTRGNVSAWQQYTLAYPSATDNGGQYFRIVNGAVTVPSRTPGLRQYFKYVRAGAVRVAASSSDTTVVRPVAFTNGPVLVLHVAKAGSYTVNGMRPGSYALTAAPAVTPSTVTLPGTVTLPVGVVTLSAIAAAPPPPVDSVNKEDRMALVVQSPVGGSVLQAKLTIYDRAVAIQWKAAVTRATFDSLSHGYAVQLTLRGPFDTVAVLRAPLNHPTRSAGAALELSDTSAVRFAPAEWAIVPKSQP